MEARPIEGYVPKENEKLSEKMRIDYDAFVRIFQRIGHEPNER